MVMTHLEKHPERPGRYLPVKALLFPTLSTSGGVVGIFMASISAVGAFLPNSLAISLGEASKTVKCFPCGCFSKSNFYFLKQIVVSARKLIRFVFIHQRRNMQMLRSSCGSSQELPNSVGEWNASFKIAIVRWLVDIFLKKKLSIRIKLILLVVSFSRCKWWHGL